MRRDYERTARKMKISVKVYPSLSQRRLKLIDLVLNEGIPVVRAARRLELKTFTARSIVDKYKREGVVFDINQKKFVIPEDTPEEKPS
jgi:transposase